MLWLGILLFSVSVTADFMTPNYRLPENLKPTHYRLDLVTDLDNFKFTGEVWIKVKCLKATKVIVLHSVGLVVSLEGIRVERMGADSKPVRVTGGSSFDVFTIDVDPSLEAGQTYSIYIPYSGKLGQNLNGYYRSRYLHRPSNTTRWLGVTKFEPFYAREAFPCFDEPAMKAKFSIRLAHKDTYTAISNMPVAKTIPMKNRKGWSWDEFEESVPMSTYLVAWMISDFGYKAPPHQNGVQFRIWARKDALNQVNFAADIGPKVLKNYEKLFDIKYPLPKQDMAAIPDFGAGAMENWGLITYRETKLLYDPSRPSVKDRERIAYVIAHELAHQWFGNLVTMKWWSDLWLNEGFATFVGTLGADAVLKGFNYLKEASIAYIAAVYELDSLKSSHPISVKVGGGWEIEEIFDAISYKKGSTVLRMMYNFLGADTFNKGVSNYLKAHKYSNAEQDDLWAALTNQAHEDKVLPGKMTVKQIMDSWTLQTGYPVLKVERDYKDGTAYVSQERFLHVKSEDHKDKPICWWFPLTYTTQPEANFKDLSPKQWLHCEEKKEKIKNLVVGPDKWLIVNIQLTGLARVMYDSKNWQLIINTLNSDNFKTIDELNRAGLIMDSFDFAQRGDLPYDTALKLSAYLSRETAALPLTRGMIALSFLDHMMSRTSNYGTFKQHMKRILTPLYSRYNKLAAMPKDIEKSRIHILLSRKFCKYKIGDCVEQAGHLYENWRHNGDSDNAIFQTPISRSQRKRKGAKGLHNMINPVIRKIQVVRRVIPPDLTGLVLCTAVRQGGEKVWNEMYKKFQNAKDANEKSSILGALRCSNEVRILKRLLEYSIDPKSAIRKQDSANVFAGVASRDHGFSVAFDFFQQRFDDIYAYIPRKNKIGKYLTSLASKIMSQHELDKLKNLVDEHPQEFEASKFQTKQALEKATLNIKWHKENYEKVSKLLA